MLKIPAGRSVLAAASVALAATAAAQTPPPPTPAQGVADPVISFGLVHYTRADTRRPFLDLMKAQDPIEAEGIALDEHGWPLSIKRGQEGPTFRFGTDYDPFEPYLRGLYTIGYEGAGRFGTKGVKVRGDRPGALTVLDRTGKEWRLTIETSDPAGTGDHLRDITVVKREWLELFEAGAMFNPDYIDAIADARGIRFLSWMEANNTVGRDLEDASALADQSWRKGAPVEVLVRLANEIGADPWFNIPIEASEAYVRAFATYVRDHLDPRLVASVELSNETWNTRFAQAQRLIRLTREDWGTVRGHRVDGYHTKLATEVALIWDDVFGEEAETRLRQVLAGQAGHHSRNRHRMNAKHWFDFEPDAAVAPSEVFDAFTVAGYFGRALAKPKNDNRETLTRAVVDPEIDAAQLLYDWSLDPERGDSLPANLDELREDAAIATEHGLDFVLYEGGQHIHSGGLKPPLNDFMIEFVRSPKMADLYMRLWDGWMEIGDGPFRHAGDIRRPNRWGSWGLLSHVGDTNAVAEAVFGRNRTEARWWPDERAPGTFLQGVTLFGDERGEEMVGTVEEDYLIGRGGDDTLWGHDRNDGLNGGPGDDRLYGGPGDDRLVGGPGDDLLVSGPGGGTMVGGPGRDRFVLAPAADGKAQRVEIEDFDPAEDELVIEPARAGTIQREASRLVMRFDDGDEIVLPGVDGALSPFVSPVPQERTSL